MKRVLLQVSKAVISAFYPNTCVSCNTIIDEDEHLCSYCYEMIKRCDPLKRCSKCGMLKSECICSRTVYSFDGCIAPFYNCGEAQSAMYNYKFVRHRRNAEFFAKNMALCVVNEYRDIRFDAIAFVPSTNYKISKRGFDHCYEITRIMSQILGLPLIKDALYCTQRKGYQHDLSSQERYKRAKELYKYTRRNDNKTILLVDDIKTTGATLDACAKQLLLSGANKVYCVTGLLTHYKKGDRYGN